MGRTLKRVPLDFAWPLGKTWGGYVNPFYHQSIKCPACDGSGYSPQAARFKAEWYGYADFDPVAYGAEPLMLDHPEVQAFARRNCERTPGHYGNSERDIAREARRLFDMWSRQWSHNLIQADVDALLAEGRLMDFTRVPRNEEQREIVRKKMAAGGNSWLPEDNGYVPTAAEVNAWSIPGMGHDAINCGVCIDARCEREGVPKLCAACEGNGTMWPSKKIEKQADRWKRTDPPTGDGYQLWETTSEGSPSSPVFATIDELCTWCAEHATTFGSSKASAAEWRALLDADFVCHREGHMVFL